MRVAFSQDREHTKMHAGQFELHAALEDDHWWFRVRRRILLDQLPRPGQPQSLLVEIGCGTGGNLRGFAAAGWSVLGIDADARAVELARERVPGDVHDGDFRDVLADLWPRVEVLVLADVLEHVADDRGFLADALRALPTGCTILITVPALQALWSHHDVVLGHQRRYGKSDLTRLLSGFPELETDFVSYFNTVLFPIIGLARLVGRLRNAPDQDASDLQAHHPLVNGTLAGLFGLERPLLRRRIGLPIGASLLAVARRR